jgi:hypothetical protein
MLDIKWIRANPEELDRSLKRRGQPPLADQVLKLDQDVRGAQTDIQEMQTKRNTLTKEIRDQKKALPKSIEMIDVFRTMNSTLGLAAAMQFATGDTMPAADLEAHPEVIELRARITRNQLDLDKALDELRDMVDLATEVMKGQK